MPSKVPAGVAFVLFLLFVLGLGLSVFAFVDLRWTHWLLTREVASGTPSVGTGGPADSVQLEQLRRSILNLRVADCSGNGESVGTGFVVKPGYVATSAHLLTEQQLCDAQMRLIDSSGRSHQAALEGLSVTDDLAVLRISDTSLPSLQLADSTAYENPREPEKVVTIGYPLEQAGASAQDNAGVSDEGTLSRFDREHNLFVTSGLNLNPGNSGGPIFLRKNWQVLGIARAKLSRELGDGVGYVVPIRTFQTFFREKTGEDLR